MLSNLLFHIAMGNNIGQIIIKDINFEETQNFTLNKKFRGYMDNPRNFYRTW